MRRASDFGYYYCCYCKFVAVAVVDAVAVVEAAAGTDYFAVAESIGEVGTEIEAEADIGIEGIEAADIVVESTAAVDTEVVGIAVVDTEVGTAAVDIGAAEIAEHVEVEQLPFALKEG